MSFSLYHLLLLTPTRLENKGKYSLSFICPATKWGGAYSFALVGTYVLSSVHLSHFVVLFLSPKLLLQYLM